MKVLGFGVLLVAATACAAPPTNCTFPQTLQAALAGSEARPHVNETKCVVNHLQTRALQTARSEVVCASYHANQARFQKATLISAALLTGDESITVSVTDTTAPAMLEATGLMPLTGTGQIDVWIFNRDAASSRQGRVCATITRP